MRCTESVRIFLKSHTIYQLIRTYPWQSSLIVKSPDRPLCLLNRGIFDKTTSCNNRIEQRYFYRITLIRKCMTRVQKSWVWGFTSKINLHSIASKTMWSSLRTNLSTASSIHISISTFQRLLGSSCNTSYNLTIASNKPNKHHTINIPMAAHSGKINHSDEKPSKKLQQLKTT